MMTVKEIIEEVNDIHNEVRDLEYKNYILKKTLIPSAKDAITEIGKAIESTVGALMNFKDGYVCDDSDSKYKDIYGNIENIQGNLTRIAGKLEKACDEMNAKIEARKKTINRKKSMDEKARYEDLFFNACLNENMPDGETIGWFGWPITYHKPKGTN